MHTFHSLTRSPWSSKVVVEPCAEGERVSTFNNLRSIISHIVNAGALKLEQNMGNKKLKLNFLYSRRKSQWASRRALNCEWALWILAKRRFEIENIDSRWWSIWATQRETVNGVNIYRYSIIESRRLRDTSGKMQAELGNSLNRKRWESIRCISFKFKFEKIQNFIITHLDVRVPFFRSRGKLLCFIYIYSNESNVPAGDESAQILCKKSALSTLNQFQQNLCLYYRVFPAQALDQLELLRL